jgi:hypothetical protein
MKKIFYCLLITSIILSCNNADHNHGQANSDDGVIISAGSEPAKDKGSQKAYVSKKINDANITIRYYSPAVRNRQIWGSLVPFDKVWVAGAHSATSIESDRGLIVEGKTIPAGKYGFFAIPGNPEWTLIINKNWDQHLADEYDEKDDLLRWKVKPDTASSVQERLMYDIDQPGEYKGNFELVWEKLRIKTPFDIQR